ncbi:hypothetical protein DAPPUDRAFT_346703 [Daphnia pulex]|uniref:Uncharacterized protein n=1 Tax=Daphnia pulex TaxID=6669 RepID=E9I808_DAPPU|nr:hypothetical protein DAPPUDRAFT_346703 [Daphnia pulex]|eukprot:EFX59873.1 hypothetical protein DAPPUDRAFT_346703 [Daphnia pulex]
MAKSTCKQTYAMNSAAQAGTVQYMSADATHPVKAAACTVAGLLHSAPLVDLAGTAAHGPTRR